MQQHSFKSILFGLTFLLAAVACEKDPKIEPIPNPLSPQQQLPNPLPAKALVRQLKRTEIDHETFTYNDKGQVSQMRAQWQYDQSDPTQIRTLTYDFEYDTANKPTQMRYTGGFLTKYAYHGNLIHRTKEFYPGGDWAKEVTYIYANNQIAQEIWHINGLPDEPVRIYKHELGYDYKGNLTKVKTYERIDDATYKLLETLEYSDFDDKINPTSWMLRYPFLPQVRWQMNNPRRQTRHLSDGSAQVNTHEYTYNGEGLPISRRTTSAGGAQTTVYIY